MGGSGGAGRVLTRPPRPAAERCRVILNETIKPVIKYYRHCTMYCNRESGIYDDISKVTTRFGFCLTTVWNIYRYGPGSVIKLAADFNQKWYAYQKYQYAGGVFRRPVPAALRSRTAVSRSAPLSPVFCNSDDDLQTTAVYAPLASGRVVLPRSASMTTEVALHAEFHEALSPSTCKIRTQVRSHSTRCSVSKRGSGSSSQMYLQLHEQRALPDRARPS